MNNITKEEFGNKMKQFFNVGRFDYLDKLLFVATRGEVHIDTLAFDDLLHKRFGEYEDELGLSMYEIIKKEYGTEAANFIKNNI